MHLGAAEALLVVMVVVVVVWLLLPVAWGWLVASLGRGGSPMRGSEEGSGPVWSQRGGGWRMVL